METPELSRTHEKPRTAPALLDFASVCDRVGRERGRPARLAFWRGAKSGTFPAPVKTSPGGSRIFWRRDEIERWIADRPRVIYAKAKDDNATDLADRDALAVAWVEANWPKETAPLTRGDLEGLLSALHPPEELAGPILTHLLASGNATEQNGSDAA